MASNCGWENTSGSFRRVNSKKLKNAHSSKWFLVNRSLLSARRIPADIPKSKIVRSSIDKLDPKKQLREAGYPFDHIGSELVHLDGKFEMVSKDVLLLKNDFERKTSELSKKIESETASV